MAAESPGLPAARFDGTLPAWVEARKPPLEQRLEVLASAAELLAQMHGRMGGAERVGACRDLGPDCLQIHEDEAGPHIGLSRGARAESERLARPEGVSELALSPFAPVERQIPTDAPAEPSADVHALAAITWLTLTGGYPEALAARQAALLPEARELIELHLLGEDRNEADDQRMNELRALSLDHFFLGEELAPLSVVDRALFKTALADLLRDRATRAAEIAAEIATILLPELERALAPEPSERLGDARRLGDALRRAASVVEAGVEPPPAPVVASEPAPAPVVAPAAETTTLSQVETVLMPMRAKDASQAQDGSPTPTPAAAPAKAPAKKGSTLPMVVAVVVIGVIVALGLLLLRHPEGQTPQAPAPAAAIEPAPVTPAPQPVAEPAAAEPAAAEPAAAAPAAPASSEATAPPATPTATKPAAPTSKPSAAAASTDAAASTARKAAPEATKPAAETTPAAAAPAAAAPAQVAASPAEPAGPPTSLKLKITMADGSKPSVYLDGATSARSLTLDPGRQHAINVQNVDGVPCNFAVQVALDGESCTWTMTTARGTFSYKTCDAVSVQCDEQGNIRQP